MSLVENLARRQHRSLDLLHGIEVLQQKGYDAKTIAKKTGLTEKYATAILELLEMGEERLLSAVEAGHIPISVAVTIANSPNDEQKALQEAYENNELRGGKLKMAKRLLETRKQRGKGIRHQSGKGGRSRKAGAISSQDVLKIYQKEVDRKRLLTRKADAVSSRMLFITEALRRLYVRYMDDFILLGENKDFLRNCKTEIENACAEKLHLKLNAKTQIGMVKNGIDFLGYNHKLTATGKITKSIRASARERQKQYLKTIAYYYMEGVIDDDYLASRQASFLAHAAGTKDKKFLNNRLNSLKRAKRLTENDKNP